MIKKVGKPRTNLVYDDAKNLIDGLSWDKSNRTYFTRYKDEQGKLIKKNLGRDKTEAISKFRSWQNQGGLSETGKRYIENVDRADFIILSKRLINKLSSYGIDLQSADTMMDTYRVRLADFVKASLMLWEDDTKLDELFCDKARELILKNQVLAAQKMKLAGLATANLYEVKPSLTLEQIGNNYFNRKNPINPKELKNLKASWEKFVGIVGVKTINLLNREKIRDYFDAMLSDYKSNDLSPITVKAQFERVRRIFNYALDTLDQTQELLEVKQRLRSVLKAPQQRNKSITKRIPRDLFWSIMEASTVEERCMWLLSVNLAFYSIDIVSLPLSAINLKNKTVIFRRGKTGVHRAGILWDQSIKSIKAYQKEKPHNSDLLFMNLKDKKPYSPSRIRKKFNAVMIKIGKRVKTTDKRFNPANYVHNNFRDSFQSIAAEKGIAQRSIDAVMGHTQSMADKYTDPESAPLIASPACLAVHDYYFSK